MTLRCSICLRADVRLYREWGLVLASSVDPRCNAHLDAAVPRVEWAPMIADAAGAVYGYTVGPAPLIAAWDSLPDAAPWPRWEHGAWVGEP